MGGKTKQAQRTKNNARPSSSGRSAELLGSFGTGAGAGMALFPTLAAVAPDAALAPDLALCIKKLNKKDPITKTKALQELNELVQNSEVDDVAAMLPNWTYYYKILSVDPDRRVRELTQVCHGAVVQVCGRLVAPQLKMLLPHWLAAQHDEHAPARSHAHRTLHSTFPDNKLPDAISFCKAEILAYVSDSLLDPAASVSRKLDDEEERTSAVTRVLVGALGGLRYIAHQLPEAHSSWLWDQLAPLLNSNVFWKLAGHSATEVRAAWYNALGALAQRFGAQWGSAHGQRAMRLIVNTRETGPAARALWAALILQLGADEQWYSRLDKKELLTKRIIEIVEAGGWGSAKALSEVVPQLIKLLPAEAVTSEFCSSLFDAWFTGLEKRAVSGSKSESAWWCCGVTGSLGALAGRADLPPDAAPCALARCVRALLAARPRPLAPALLHRLLASWAGTPRLELLLRSFWQNVACTTHAQVTALGPAHPPAELSALLHAHTAFLLALHRAHEEPKKPKGVKFADDIDPEENENSTSESTVESPGPTDTKIDAEVSLLLKHQLDECVQRVYSQYMELAKANSGLAECILQGLLPTLETVGSKELWAAMGQALAGRQGSPFLVWECGLRGWLGSEAARGIGAVRATFLLLKYLTDSEQAAVFAAFDELDAVVCDWILPLAVWCGAGGAGAWLRGGGARAAVLRAARRALAGDGEAEETLLRCLQPLPDGELLCGEDTASEVQQLVAYVVSHASGDGEQGSAAGLLARMLTLLAHRATLATDQLIVAQVTHQLNQIDNNTFPEEHEDWAHALWLDNVRALPPPRRAPLLLRLRELVLHHLPAGTKDLEVERIVQCASLAASLATCDDDSSTALALLQPHADCDPTVHALRADIVAGTINCPFDDQPLVAQAVNDETPLVVSETLPFLRWCVFRAGLVRALCGLSARCPLEHADTLRATAGLLRDQAVVSALRGGHAAIADYELLAMADTHLTAILSDVTARLPAPVLAALRAELGARAALAGRYWARAASTHRALAACSAHAAPTGDGLFHTMQAALTCPAEDLPPPPPENHTSGRLSTLHAVMCRSLHAVQALRDGALEGLLRGGRPASADVIIDAYYRREEILLFDTDISEAPWGSAVLAATTADFLTALVEEQGWDARARTWDFATIAVSSLMGSLAKSKAAWGTTKVAMVARPVLRLLCAIYRFVRAVPSESMKRQPSEHVGALPGEWADLFAPVVALHVYTLLLHILDEAKANQSLSMTSPRAQVLSCMCSAVRAVSWSDLKGLPARRLSPQRLAASAAPALAARTHHAHKYLAHCTLRALRAHSIHADAEKLRAWSARSGETDADSPAPPLALHALHEPLAAALAAQHAAPPHRAVGEEICELAPHTEAHSLALGWLLLVETLGTMMSEQRGELRLHYAELVRDKRYTSLVLPAALSLLPPLVAQYALAPANSAAAPKQPAQLFLTTKEFSVDEPSLSSDVSALACRALHLSLAGYGAGEARSWWGAAGSREARALARVARAYITPHLVRAQLKAVADRGSKELPDAEITVHWSASEVTCCVYVEERRVELSIRLPPLYPLVLPAVLSPAPHPHSPAPHTHWLAVYLAYQNGSLLSALQMWVTAVTTRVEAAPQCYICYCRLHPTSGRLPSVPCHQCKNKFHPHCLRKWFTSSNKSNCPLCRAAF